MSETKSAVYTTLISMTATGALLALTGLIFGDGILWLMGTPQELFSDASVYLKIYTLALLFIVPTLFIAFQWLQERLRPVQSAPTHDWQIEEEIKVSEEEKSRAGKE